jgi:hypothetical protein
MVVERQHFAKFLEAPVIFVNCGQRLCQRPKRFNFGFGLLQVQPGQYALQKKPRARTDVPR